MTLEVVLMWVLIGVGVLLLPKILKVLIAIGALILAGVLMVVAGIMSLSVVIWRHIVREKV